MIRTFNIIILLWTLQGTAVQGAAVYSAQELLLPLHPHPIAIHQATVSPPIPQVSDPERLRELQNKTLYNLSQGSKPVEWGKTFNGYKKGIEGFTESLFKEGDFKTNHDNIIMTYYNKKADFLCKKMCIDCSLTTILCCSSATCLLASPCINICQYASLPSNLFCILSYASCGAGCYSCCHASTIDGTLPSCCKYYAFTTPSDDHVKIKTSGVKEIIMIR